MWGEAYGHNPITGLNHPAGTKRRRSLPTWRRGFVGAGAEPTEEAGLWGQVSGWGAETEGARLGALHLEAAGDWSD